MLEDIPRYGPELAEELRRVGTEIKKAAEKKLAEFYPSDSDGAQPIAYLWARTVRCEAPNCGAEIPLARSFWLAKKEVWKHEKGRRVKLRGKQALRYRMEQQKDQPPEVIFEIFEPKSEAEVPKGTVSRAKATCLCCNRVLAPDRVRAQLAIQRGGADVVFDENGQRIGGARLLAVVTVKSGDVGRRYRLPMDSDYKAVWKAMKRSEEVTAKPLTNGISLVPDEPLPKERQKGNSGFRVLLYGMETFGDLFNARQKLALITLVDQVRRLDKVINRQKELKELLVFCINKLADLSNTCCRWEPIAECPRQLFARQAVPIVWDPSEGVPIGESSGSFNVMLEREVYVLNEIGSNWLKGQVELTDACQSPVPDDSVSIWFTDPPYYDAVAYADLSDFFFVWLKRTLPGHRLLRDPFDPDNPLTPKTREAIQDRARKINGQPKDRNFYEMTMAKAFAEGRRILKNEGIGCVVFAHKTTEGWEALLSGMIRGGWVITSSWPIATEMSTRLVARESAALATSIHLVCRPRPEDAPVGDWGDVLQELPRRISEWMKRLQGEGVRGADLVFACIGPALEVFSRYAKVETAEGREVSLAEFLEKVWEVVGRIALEQVLGSMETQAQSDAGAIEEDARLTALFLWTLQSTNGEATSRNGEEGNKEEIDEVEDEDETPRSKKKGFTLVFDVVRRFAQPLGIHLPAWEGRIIETQKGIVRLLSVTERAKQLFGEEGAQAVADQFEQSSKGSVQLTLFPQGVEGVVPTIQGQGHRSQRRVEVSEEALQARREATTLDRVHAAMLLQASGRANALRALLAAEQRRGPDFLRLANALSALYPPGSEEKRLLDAMLLAMPR